MKSSTSIVARQYRLHEWADQICECNRRPDNLTVKEWCSQHQITVANYYYRLKQVRMVCLDKLSKEPSTQSVVPVPSELMADVSSTQSCLEMKVDHISLYITGDTTPELLKMVLQVLADVE